MATQGAMLVTRVGRVACALPIAHVVETMRPLPIEPIARAGEDALAIVIGIAVIRGAAVPVIDARKLLGVEGGPATRLVVLETGERRIALAVDAVLDVQEIDAATLERLPPLLASARRESVSALATRDAELMVVLDAARALPEEQWRALTEPADFTRERGGAHSEAR